MELLRRLFTSALLGIVLGAAAAALLAPAYLDWYNAPGTESPMCNCMERTRNTASSLLGAQITGGLIGGAALLILGLVLTVRRKRPSQPRAGGTSPDPASGSTPSSTAPPSVPRAP